MRSRYSAYVMRHDAYLTDTWHPSTRPTSPPEQEPGLRWLGLQVLRHHLVDETHAERLALLPAYLRVFAGVDASPAELRAFRHTVSRLGRS